MKQLYKFNARTNDANEKEFSAKRNPKGMQYVDSKRENSDMEVYVDIDAHPDTSHKSSTF